jgi:hypothetical protein
MAKLEGGAVLKARLEELSAKVNRPGTLNVGFLENAPYPDGTQVAYIAAIQEFGGTFDIPERNTTIYRKLNKDGTFSKNGKFVKKRLANVATDHVVPAHKMTIPARPYFRTMIADKSPHWGDDLGKVLVARDYDVSGSLKAMGEEMQGQLVASIDALIEPALAPETVKKKGFSKPLVDSGVMRSAVNFEVKE